jgi:RsiW-degrading membrane proteinase PrsW (M82 family)
MSRRALRYLGHSTLSGVLGWFALMAAFEAVWLAECWMIRRRNIRKR